VKALPFALPEASGLPLFLALSRSIAEDIGRGRLLPGQKLPGSRTLAEQLGIHRNTVLSAFNELEQEGWIETLPKRGTFVVRSFPESPRTRRAVRATVEPIRLELPEMLPPEPYPPPQPGVLPLVGGLPDLRLIPRAELARAYRRALTRAPHTLGYGSEWGNPRLLRALGDYLAETRGVVCEEGGLLTTRGSQMAIHLCARALLPPGAAVAVEALGYRPAWEALKLAGARLLPVPVDAQGLDVNVLRELCRRERIRLLYVTPHHQYPTTVTLTAPRRAELVALARQERFAILEDDYDHEHHYDGRPVLPLASLAPDVVVYVGTFSKVLAPGLRLGYVAGPRDVLERAARLRLYLDRQSDLAVEEAVAELIEDGELGRHLRRSRRRCLERRDALVDALRRRLGAALSFDVPAGGMALWARAHGRVSVEAWAERALAKGVLVQPGRRFQFDGRTRPYFRLGFGALNPDELNRAVTRFAEAMPR
jgi:GntR family transcriptional regulator / MocR family aminotransferase